MRTHLPRFAICLFVLTGCQGAPEKVTFPEPSYAHLGQIQLAVDVIEVVEAYRPPFEAPNVEHLLPVAPMAAARAWALDRLAAAGGDRNRAVFTIQDARVVETILETKGGVRGMFTVDQSERYDAQLSVELNILGPGGGSRGSVTVTVKRARSVPENITLSERDQVWFELTGALIDDMNRELESSISAYLGSYLR